MATPRRGTMQDPEILLAMHRSPTQHALGKRVVRVVRGAVLLSLTTAALVCSAAAMADSQPDTPTEPARTVAATHPAVTNAPETRPRFERYDHPRVLIICSYERYANSTRGQEDAIRSAIEKAFPVASVRSDYLLTLIGNTTLPGKELRDVLARQIDLKWRHFAPDLIITIDTFAYDLLTNEAGDVFPNTPIVFSGLVWNAENARNRSARATGVLERPDYIASLNLIKTLHPRTTRVHVISHGTELAKQNQLEFEEVVAGKTLPVAVTWSKGITNAEIAAEIKSLSETSVVLFISFFATDTLGSSRGDSVFFQTEWPVPVHCVYASNVVPNVLGGLVISSQREGASAGDMAVRILSGTPVHSITPLASGAVTPVFRSRQLKRWDVAERMLPADSKVLDRPPSLFTRFAPHLWWAIPILVVQSVIIGALVLHRRRSRAAETALAEKERRLQQAVEGSMLSIWEWNPNTDESYWTGHLEGRLNPNPPSGAKSGIWRAALHPDDAPGVMAALNDHLEFGTRYDIEYRLLVLDGEYRWFRSRGAAIRDQQGRVLRMVGTLTDVHDRVVATQRVRESEAQFRRIVETTEEGIWLVGPDWNTTFVNRRMGEMLGHAPEAMLGRHIFEFMEDSARQSAQAAMQNREQDLRGSHEFQFIRADGTPVWTITSTNAILGEHGAFVGALAMVTDISARVASERLRERQRNVLERLAAGAPLNDVLHAIIRFVQEHDNEVIGSILLLQPDKTVITAAAPNLPPEFSASIDGIRIGPEVGSCGTAMHRRQTVVVSDIASDPLWASFKERALHHGLRACWSEPIVSSSGDVLGSMAMYSRTARGPNTQELELIRASAGLAGIAIERLRADSALRRSEATQRALLDAIPDVMFRMSRDGTYLDYHAPPGARLILPPEEFLGKRVLDVLPRQLATACQEHLERLFKTNLPQTYEYEFERDQRRSVHEVRMIRVGREEALLLVRNITQRREAERRARESEHRFALLVNSTPLGVIVWNLDFTVSEWNPGAEKIFGYTSAEAVGRHASFIVPEAQRKYVDQIIGELKKNTGGFRGSNANIRKDGREIFCEWYNTPLVDDRGRVVSVASVIEDITDQRNARRRQDFMLSELDHRVKNNLASVLALAAQTGQSTASYPDFMEVFSGRLRAMARMHAELARSRWRGADLLTLATQTLEAFVPAGSNRATIQGPPVMLNPRACQAITMALNELATNAAKYGALSNPSGSIELTWSIVPAESAGGAVKLLWTESGGPPVTEPLRKGFGSALIEGAVAHELRGTATIHFPPGGLQCTFVFPLEALTPDADSPPERSLPPEGSTLSPDR